MWIALYISTVLCSIFFVQGVPDEFIIPKNAIYFAGGLVVIALSFTRDKPIIQYKNIWVFLGFLFIVLSWSYYYFMPFIFRRADGSILWNVWNYVPSLNALIGIFLLKTLIEGTDTLRRWIIMAKVLCYTCLACSVYAVMQRFGLDQIFSEANGWYVKDNPGGAIYYNSKLISFMGNDFLTSNFIAIVSPLFLIFKELRYKIFYGVCLAAMYFLNSAISIVAMVVGFLTYITLSKQWRVLCVSVCLLIVLFSIKIYKDRGFLSSSGRMTFWEMTLKECKKMPLTGYGLGGFISAKHMVGNDRFGLIHLSRVHNDYIQILYEGGIILLGVTIMFIYDLFQRIIFIKPTPLSVGYMCGFISFLIIAIGGFPLEFPPLALLGIIYIASLEAQIRGDEYAR